MRVGSNERRRSQPPLLDPDPFRVLWGGWGLEFGKDRGVKTLAKAVFIPMFDGLRVSNIMMFCPLFSLLAFAPPAANGQQAPAWVNMVPLLIMGVAFYFVLIRPQQKKAREHADMLKTLRAGDRVVISGGIVGVVVGVKDTTVSIRSADSKFEALKSSVTDVTERGNAGSSEN